MQLNSTTPSPAQRREQHGGDTQLDALTAIRAASSAAGAGLYLGSGTNGPAWGRPEQAVLVLGPPRSGKTSSVVIPSVLAAPGAVLSTSTKPDVLRSTVSARARIGPCFLYDPSGTVDPPSNVERLRWSPVRHGASWDDALLVARGMVGAGRSDAAINRAASSSDHFHERAEALLATVLHAASLDGAQMKTVLSWVDRRLAAPALGVLDRHGATIAADLLAGIAATEAREQSGIWSTASGVLAAYRSRAALSTTEAPDFDAVEFCNSSATLYVAATGRHQALVAPLVVGLLTDVRSALYARQAARSPGDERLAPVVLALDEVANIAPLPDLPTMVSEGGGQGLLTLACLQDLSQARSRWGTAADGLLSLFGTTIILPGIADVRTLEALSALAGEEEVCSRSVNAPLNEGGGVGRMLFSRMTEGSRRTHHRPSVTTSTVRRRRLPVDIAGRGQPGMALVIDERNYMGWVRLTPWFSTEPWRSAGPAQRTCEPDLVNSPSTGTAAAGRTAAGRTAAGSAPTSPKPEAGPSYRLELDPEMRHRPRGRPQEGPELGR
jgi:type IV secretion system protein VirD4